MTSSCLHYLKGYTLYVKTQNISRSKDRSIKVSTHGATLIGHLAKWVMILSELDIQYVDDKAIKGQAISNQLTKAPIQDDHPFLFDFPDDSIFNITPTTK